LYSEGQKNKPCANEFFFVMVGFSEIEKVSPGFSTGNPISVLFTHQKVLLNFINFKKN